ncbi:MAG: HD domain-containing protein [Mitsuaria chitosanitabida]|uniref:phosphoribosyltransferase-like protein n=1 Tax=Roseateles chitosanitabidus TaxID=65048 RepID=UPI001B20EC2B|nr:HD domain-containing protein [Roseateles chitosanitabidus]MBO9687085.1 HD domain-containing protein [Roseateles chitosanitabidus]
MSAAQDFTPDALQALAEQFAAEHLDDYVAELKQPGHAFERKQINDALWGTIGLHAAEVALLDSPLLQRLRNVRQLGVVHWVYPGAVHTRFEHSLGVLHQIQNLMSAINSIARTDNDSTPVISQNFVHLMRLAALLHDVGHAAFSHVSEMAVQGLPELQLLPAEFARQRRAESKQLSEMFAYYVVRSPAMKRFFKALFNARSNYINWGGDIEQNVEQTVEKIGDAILGRHIDSRVPLMHELISGPFDADKLDYFSRDARLAGTPSVIDISRLVQKLSVRALDAGELPADIARKVAKIDSKYYLVGVKWSGVAVLDELHLARVLLFAKIYRHPKVIAIEQMLRAAIVTIAPLVSIEKLLGFLYRHPDDSILNMGAKQLQEHLEIEAAPDQEADVSRRLQCAANLLKAVRDRRLWVRAFQIPRSYPNDPLADNQEQKDGLFAFQETLEHPQQRADFMRELLDDVASQMAMRGDTKASRQDLDSLVMVHTQGTTPGGAQIQRAFLISSSGTPMLFRNYTVNRSGWAEGYLTDQPKAFVFSPAHLADYVYLAVEKLVRRRFGVTLPVTALEVSKRSASIVAELKQKLTLAGYYRNAPYDIRPMPPRLEMADMAANLTKLATTFAKCSNFQQRFPEDLPAHHHIQAWLRQFDNDAHVDCALTVLNSIRVIGRDDLVKALKKFINAHPEFRGAWVVPLGSLKDSSAVQAYFAADLRPEYISRCANLEEAAAATERPKVIFVDDFVGSGGQAREILTTGFGQLSLHKPLGEERDMFSGGVQELLLNTDVGFVFAAAWDDGLAQVREICNTIKLKAEIMAYVSEAEMPFARAVLQRAKHEADDVTSFLSRCSEIGRALMVNEEKVEERLLGYGNRGLLLATALNVPAQTLTALWAEGQVDGVDWTPLIGRRKKT